MGLTCHIMAATSWVGSGSGQTRQPALCGGCGGHKAARGTRACLSCQCACRRSGAGRGGGGSRRSSQRQAQPAMRRRGVRLPCGAAAAPAWCRGGRLEQLQACGYTTGTSALHCSHTFLSSHSKIRGASWAWEARARSGTARCKRVSKIICQGYSEKASSGSASDAA